MRKNRNRPVNGSWRTRAAVRLARTIGKSAATPRRIRVLDGLHSTAVQASPEFAHYRRLFRKTQPRVLLCSHQRPTEIIAPVLAARSLGIPTATFIFSWDNLSSKGRIAAPFDHFLVWSDHMLQEMLRYYPDVSPERIHVVGTPQFDPYADPSLQCTRDEFFRRSGADPSRALICFSGGDAGNAVEDPQHLAALMRHIRAGRIRNEPQVLLRCCPSDDAGRFEGVLRQYPEVIFARPAWHHAQQGNWAAALPSREDVQFLVNLTRHADLNINFASTMTLDFAIHDKPVINLAFDVSDPPRFGMSMWEYYNRWDHYRPVIELGAARFARSQQELAEHVNAYLENPSLDRAGRRRFKELQVGVPIGQSSQRIIDVIEQLARQERSSSTAKQPPRTAVPSC